MVVSTEGLVGDAIVDKQNHGGPDQAIYVFGGPDYAWWSKELGHELPPGTFGENLTISELESAPMRIGDRLCIGAVILEITAPRIPCITLATRMGDPLFVKRFRHGERPGLYCRVIVPGEIQTGTPVTLVPYAGETLTVLEMFRFFYHEQLPEAELRRQLAAPIDIRARKDVEEKLAKLYPIADTKPES